LVFSLAGEPETSGCFEVPAVEVDGASTAAGRLGRWVAGAIDVLLFRVGTTCFEDIESRV
jgi:hypothetical protein